MASASGYTSLEEIYRDDTILAKTLVVKNIPKQVPEDSLQNFLEVVCKEDVDCLIYSEKCYPRIAVFKNVVTDLQECQDKLQTKKLENETVQLEHIGSVKGLFLPDVPEACTHDCLLFYFESKKRSGGSEEHVEGVNIDVIGGKHYAVVTISDKSVIEAILSKPEHKPNGQQEVKIEPYFSSVHDYLLEKLKENVSGQARIVTDYNTNMIEGNDKDMRYSLAIDARQRQAQARSIQTDVKVKKKTKSVMVNNTKVTIKQGNIMKQKASALVNIVVPSENINEDSEVSTLFVEAGGQKLVDNYEADNIPGPGMVTVKASQATGQLNCDVVLHVTLTEGALNCNKVVRQAMNQLLDECRNLGFKYVAFPPLGVDELYGYPADKVARCMLSETVKFLNTENEVKEFVLVIDHDETYTIFDKELIAYSDNPGTYEDASSNPEPGSEQPLGISSDLSQNTTLTISPQQSPEGQFTELAKADMLYCGALENNQNVGIGNVLEINNAEVVLMKGAITKQKASALVNIVAPSKNINDERISELFVKAGGQTLVNNYEAAKMSSKGMVTVTEASGRLNCDVVLHSTLNKDAHHCDKAVREAMIELLGECRNFACKEVAFPPLGVGHLYKYPAETVARCMLSETVKFLKTENDIKKIVFVIFDDETYTIFDNEFKEYSIKPDTSSYSSEDDPEDTNRLQPRQASLLDNEDEFYDTGPDTSHTYAKPSTRRRPRSPNNTVSCSRLNKFDDRSQIKSRDTTSKYSTEGKDIYHSRGYKEHRKTSADPGNGYKEHRKTSDDPGNGYKEHRKTSADPGNGYKECRKTSADPGNGYNEHRKTSADSGNGYKEHRKTSADPGNGYKECRKTSADPGNGDNEHRKKSADPGNGYKEHSKTSADPGNGYKEHRKTSDDPRNGYTECRKTSADPGNGYKEHRKTSDDPSNGYKEQRKTPADPGNGYKEHRKTSADPDNGYKEHRKTSYDPNNFENRQISMVTKMAAAEPRAPVYWKNFNPGQAVGSTLLTNLKLLVKNKDYLRVDIDRSDPTGIYDAILHMVNKTWDPTQIGKGKDATGLDKLPFTKMHVLKIERIENIKLYHDYAKKRTSYFVNLVRRDERKYKSIKSIRGSTGSIATAKCARDALLKDMYKDLNEHYFFHGTKPEIVDTICNQGLDSRLASGNAMLGMGVYGAESATKADQYTDDQSKRSCGKGQEKKMFLIRMILGQSFLCKEPNPHKYKRPPCTSSGCYRDDCIKHHSNFDSVVGDNGKLFREFVVYQKDQCYPEYLITYERR